MERIPSTEFACFWNRLDARLGHVMVKWRVGGGRKLSAVRPGVGREWLLLAHGLFLLDYIPQVTRSCGDGEDTVISCSCHIICRLQPEQRGKPAWLAFPLLLGDIFHFLVPLLFVD